jgi:hypothetical protein
MLSKHAATLYKPSVFLTVIEEVVACCVVDSKAVGDISCAALATCIFVIKGLKEPRTLRCRYLRFGRKIRRAIAKHLLQ